MENFKSTETARKLVDDIHNKIETEIEKRSANFDLEFQKLEFPLYMAIALTTIYIMYWNNFFEIVIVYFLTFDLSIFFINYILRKKLNNICDEMEIFFKFTDTIKPIIGLNEKFNKETIESIEKEIQSFEPREREINPKKEYLIEIIIFIIIITIGIILFDKFMKISDGFRNVLFTGILACATKTITIIRKIIVI